MKKLYLCTTLVRYYAEAESEQDARALMPKVLEYESHMWADHATEIEWRNTEVTDLDRRQCPVYAEKGPYKDLREVMDKLPEAPKPNKNDTWY